MVVVTVPEALPEVVFAASLEGPWREAPGLPAILLFIVAWIFLILARIFLFVAIPAAAVEGLGVRRSIERSVELIRNSFF